MWTGLLACLLFRHLRAEGLFKIQIPPEAKAHSVIPGRRVGHPLLGKWHLCSFVLSVIGLSALPDDSSRREAPAACQLRSIRLHSSLGCNSFFAEQRQSLTLCFFAFLPMFTPGEGSLGGTCVLTCHTCIKSGSRKDESYCCQLLFDFLSTPKTKNLSLHNPLSSLSSEQRNKIRRIN